MNSFDFDLIVIGGGHSGIEAAWAASHFPEISIALITLQNHPLGTTPCNPAIGGVGKSQLVKEIDAMMGLMGQVADQAALQYRILNDSKGYAVRSTRVQIDKGLYSSLVQQYLSKKGNIKIIFDKINSIERDNYFIVKGEKIYRAKKVIFTGGTFLNGVIHRGKHRFKAGIINGESSLGLQEIFKDIKLQCNRFKTGTPARLWKESIDFNLLQEQKSDDSALNLHYSKENKRYNPQSCCHITRTNRQTLAIIREAKEFAPLFNGQIDAIGPRYCPSIEDKAFRYPDRDEHHIFLEPEGQSNYIYPNGLSTSLPEDIQLKFLRTIKGLEKVEVAIYGYAIEYDIINSVQLDSTLQLLDCPGLYFAGQINGTSGYEEAAAQGLVAGLNAALSLMGQDAIIFQRNDCYIGVLVDDIVSTKLDSPYRLFTARHENRLFVREDNCIYRMYKYLNLLKNLVKKEEYLPLQDYLERREHLDDIVAQFSYTKEDLDHLRKEYGIDRSIKLAHLLSRSDLDPVETLKKESNYLKIESDIYLVYDLAISYRYRGYIEMNREELDRHQKLLDKKVDWQKILDLPLAHECKERIREVRPSTFAQLSKIAGIRRATISLIAAWLK